MSNIFDDLFDDPEKEDDDDEENLEFDEGDRIFDVDNIYLDEFEFNYLFDQSEPFKSLNQ